VTHFIEEMPAVSEEDYRMTMPNIGDEAPNFELPRDGGDLVKLSAFRGRNVVLYFYPRDDSNGCTIEALGFTAQAEAFSRANTIVLGVSKDTVSSHEEFRDKYTLGIPLLSDSDGDVCETYGVWREKTMSGKTFMGIVRSTFLIDAEGKIAQIWRDIDVNQHIDKVLAAVQKM
jgi:peroxiredoxin Q/BCP